MSITNVSVKRFCANEISASEKKRNYWGYDSRLAALTTTVPPKHGVD